MNHSQGWDMQSSHLSAGQNQAPPTATSGAMSQYSYQPPLLQPGPGSYPPGSHYQPYGYSNPAASPQSAGSHHGGSQMNAHLLPLPAMANGQPPQNPGQMGGAQYQQSQTMDTTGQVAPPGMKPRVTATLWEDEGSLCFQVEAKGVCVARREDNHMINGTKLLNVAGMTRGRRDGILKSEKMRNVVKIGPMHLKGVWIPFERALDFANKEKITEMLYPLFVHNIGALLYHPTNQTRGGNSLMPTQDQRRKFDNNAQMRTPQSSAPPPSLTHHHSMQHSALPGPALSSHPNSARPSLDRAHTFPTPPTSASSLMGMSSSDQSFQWGPQAINGVQGQNLSIDTGLSKAISQPTTPATTPPGAIVQSMQPYSNGQTYDQTRQMYSGAPSQQSQYAQQPAVTQHNMTGYNSQIQPNQYVKNEMGPPSARATGSEIDRHAETKPEDHLLSHDQSNGHVAHASGQEHEHSGHDGDYAQDNNASYNANRTSGYYGAAPPVEPLGSEHGHISPELTGSPHHNTSGRATPRTGTAPAQSWGGVAQTGGYSTPPRPAPPASNLYSVMGGSDQRAPTTNGASTAEQYPAQPSIGSYSAGPSPIVNGGSSNKRLRDIDDDGDRSRPGSRSATDNMDIKRRKTFQSDSLPGIGGPIGSPVYDHNGMHRAASAIAQPRR